MIQGRNFSPRLDLLGALRDALGNILLLPRLTNLSLAAWKASFASASPISLSTISCGASRSA